MVEKKQLQIKHLIPESRVSKSKIIMYTFKEAEIILDYYAEKVLGKPLSTENASSLPIFKSKIEELENGAYDVFCYGKGGPSTHFYTRIEKVANDLQLISPQEVLKLRNLN